MTELPVQTEASSYAVSKGFAASLFAFSVVLLGSLLFSELAVVPYMTSVEWNEQQYSLEDLQSYKQSLTAQLQRIEDQQRSLENLQYDPLQQQLLQYKSHQADPKMLQEDIETLVASFEALSSASVYLRSVEMNAVESTVSLKGDVRDAGLSSMTVLAAFVEYLEEAPFVASLQHSTFERKTSEEYGPYSPFTITLFLP